MRNFTLLGASILALVAMCATGASTLGCTQTACIRLDPNAFECPSSEMALAIMNPPCGPQRVASVDDDGEIEGDVCCYDVSINANVPEPTHANPRHCPATTSSAGGGAPTGGAGGFGGSAGQGGAGGSGTGGGVSNDCSGYCTAVDNACGGTELQYSDLATCAATCATFSPGNASDMSGNTLACRLYAAGAAATTLDKSTFCPGAGPGGHGVCGSDCEGYCTIVLAACTGADALYASQSACLTTCAGFSMTDSYSANVMNGDSLACRIYYATQASVDPTMNCSSAGKNSPVCL